MVTPALPEVLLVGQQPPAGARLRSQSDLQRVRRGAYVRREPTRGPARDRRALALARIRAVHTQLTVDKWFSHESAALLWGCDTVGLTGLVHVTQVTRPRSRGDDPVVRHHGVLPEHDRACVADLPVTSLARTVVDCAASLPADRGLVVADAALRLGADPGGLARVLASRAGRRGVARAREVVALADGRSQSPGETLARWALVSAGVPAPDLQVEVLSRRGRFFLDLGWPTCRVALEFDGFVKYSGELGGTAPQVVFAEKQRQDAIEDEGWRVLRATWSDLRAPAQLVARVNRALARGPR